MSSLFLDDPATDTQRRESLYNGDLFLYGPRESVSAFADHARAMIVEAFAPLDPERAQHDLPVERFAEILGELKPAFIHHSESKRHVRNIIRDLGANPERTYFDVPRMRSSTSDGYLTTGIAYAWHPHRDTWYSAPACQINWWMPIYEIAAGNTMAFHPGYWDRGVPNSSSEYNYYQWNQAHRGRHVSQMIGVDPRPLPRATDVVDPNPEMRLICPVGGIFLFSGAQLHSSVPNHTGVTRFSIDFRTVHLDDLEARRGAPNLDAECTGTTVRDYLRVSDLSPLSDEIVSAYGDGTEGEGVAVYRPESGSRGSS